MTRVVLADDHPLVLEGLRHLLASEGFEVVSACVSGTEALAALRQKTPDIIVLDLRMPGLDGLEVLTRMREERLPTRAIVLTAGSREAELIEAVRLGAAGVVLKETTSEVLVDCLRAVARGERYLQPAFLRESLDKIERGRSDVASLTEREAEIVRMVARGLRNKDIAARLFITEGTVKVHLHKIYQKLGVDGRLALLRHAEDRGLV